MASTFGGIAARVSFSASAMNKSIPVTKKIVEDNEESEIASILQAVNI